MPSLRQSRARSLAGVIAAMAVVNLVYGITFPLLALVLDGQGVSKTLIGLSTISQAVSIIAIAPFAPRLLVRFNPAAVMQVSAGCLAVLFLLAGLWQNVYFWFPLRFIIGALTALLWIASEALINELAVDQWRGRVIGIYSSVGSAGFALGPLLLVLTGSEGYLPFAATAATVALSAMPLLLVQRAASAPPDGRSAGLWTVLRLAPMIMLANVAYAASVESMITFFPLFGIHLGLGEPFALSLMTVMAVGAMILILPLGWMADRLDRVAMLTACVAITIAGLLVMPYMMQGHVSATLAFFFVFGGIEGMIYTLGVTLIGQRFKGAELAAASTAFTTCWGVGTIIGPLVAGIGMDVFGAGSLAMICAVFFTLYLPVPLMSWLRANR